MTENDGWIIKYKSAKMPDDRIAARLNMTVEEVERRWEQILLELQSSQQAGSLALGEQYRILCAQYQLIGESLKIIAGAISNEATLDDLREVIQVAGTDPIQIAVSLKKSFIILRPFQAVDPQKMAEEVEKSLARTIQGN